MQSSVFTQHAPRLAIIFLYIIIDDQVHPEALKLQPSMRLAKRTGSDLYKVLYNLHPQLYLNLKKKRQGGFSLLAFLNAINTNIYSVGHRWYPLCLIRTLLIIRYSNLQSSVSFQSSSARMLHRVPDRQKKKVHEQAKNSYCHSS